VTLAALVVAVLAAAVSLLRWLRVSQREHYLSGSVVRTAPRWLRTRPPNAWLAVAWVGLAVASFALSAATPVGAAATGLGGALVGSLFPAGMAVLGSPRLRLTRRATLQAIVAALLSAAVIAGIMLLIDTGPAAALAPAVAAVSVDVATWTNRPVERRIARRYQRTAGAKLARIRPRVIAITGSYGKTTVKNHVRDLVGTSFDTLATPASWNNMAGLSRAINEQLAAGTEVFVAEMGTYGRGEIAEMVRWLKPEVAVISAIGPVHLERMRTLETIAAAKSEILEGARAAVLCIDSPQLGPVADRVRREGTPEQLWLVGSKASSGDELDVLVCGSSPEAPGDGDGHGETLTVWIRGERLGELPRGSLHPSNVACAVAAALAAGVDKRVLGSALGKLTATDSRAVVATTEGGITVVDDTFNSNPTGAGAALASLTRLVPHGRRVVVTPGMVELGDLQDDANTRFAADVAAGGAELVIVGWTNRLALLAGHPGAITVRDRESARLWVRHNLRHGDGVLWENDLPDHYP
jgi:UDP-N-acetylmuramoyl-tripeptide--D-alanyl-D-alanine ligase